MSRTDNIIIKLEENMKSMTIKLSEIELDIKELIKVVNSQHTDSALLKQNMTNLSSKVNDLDIRLKKVEERQNYLVAKVSAVTTLLASGLSWFFQR